MKKLILPALLVTHIIAGGVGFALGIYALPILIAPPAPAAEEVAAAAKDSEFIGTFARDRIDSDGLHWGEGEFSIGSEFVSFSGELAPGPDYQLYLSSEFVETEADFERLKSKMVRVGPVKTFENFMVPMSSDVDPSQYNTAIVWCETFGEFITSGTYKSKHI